MSVGVSQKIASYRAYVDIDGGFAGLILKLENGSSVHNRTDNMAVYMAAIDLLRNESPVYYDEARKFIQTGQEATGEGDN